MTQLNFKFLHFVRRVLTVVFVLLPAGLFAQNLTLEFKDVTVQEAIVKLQLQGNYTIVVHAENVDLSKRISVSAKDLPLSDVLAQIFAGQDVDFSVDGKNVTVTHRIKQTGVSGVNAETGSFRGKVIDNNGDPLAGAALLDAKTGKYALTDEQGFFELTDFSFPVELSVSYMGFKDKFLTFSGQERQPYTVLMEQDGNVLDELVVVGYGTQKKVNLTGAVSVIDGKELNFRPVANTAVALQGADPSLVITTSSGSIDGSHYNLNIRGQLSLNSGSPLILVDGVESSLNMVNPNDIESISVLKDASACAIYGAKASAGVVLITTKSGAEGVAQITYNGRFSLSSNTTSTDFITNGYDYVKLNNDFYETYKGYGAWTYSDKQMEMLYERRNDRVENPARPWVVPDETGQYSYVYLGNFDWYKFLFRPVRPETEHNISVRGGTDRVRYYASARYLWRQGILSANVNDVYDSYSLRGKVDAKMTKWLDYSTNMSLEHTKYDWRGFYELDGSSGNASQGIMVNATQNLGPNIVPFNPDGTVVMVPGYMADASSPLMGGRGGTFVDGRNRNIEISNNWTWTHRFTAHIIKGLDFIADYSYRRRDNRSNYRSLPTANAYDNINQRLYEANGLAPGLFSNNSVRDFTKEYRYQRDGHIINAFFSYNKSFGNHNVAGTLGLNYDDYYSTVITVQQKGSLSEDLSYINMANGEIETAEQSNSAYRTLGCFIRMNYDYAGRYLLEFSGRYDGSSRFPKGNRWGFFPSASAGWRLSEEPFWTNIKPYVSNAKLRISYGSLGNQQVSNYYYWEELKTDILGFTFNDTQAGYAYVDAPVSSTLTWETVVSQNIGIDLGFFENRLSLNADFYIRDTKNMLTEGMALPAVYGETAPKENAADLRTNGYELILSWKDNHVVAGKPLYYGITATLGDNVTHITRFNNDQKLLSKNYVGKRLGDIWGYVTDGVFATDAEAALYEKSVDAFSTVYRGIQNQISPWNHLMAGDIKYVDVNKDGKINTGDNTLTNPGDRKVIGNKLPRYNYAIKGDFSWYGIDLSVFFQGVGKVDWNPSSNCTYFWGPYSFHRSAFIPSDFESKCWSDSPEADNSRAIYPRKRGRVYCNTWEVVSDYFLYSAAYLRLKNLTIGYTLPIKSKVLEKARIYFSGENLFYFSPLRKVTKYIDPEVATSSVADDVTYPFSRTFSFGVDITF